MNINDPFKKTFGSKFKFEFVTVSIYQLNLGATKKKGTLPPIEHKPT